MDEIFSLRVYLDPNPPETYHLLVKPFLDKIRNKAKSFGKEIEVTVVAAQTTYEYRIDITYKGAKVRGEAKAFVGMVLSGVPKSDIKYIKS